MNNHLTGGGDWDTICCWLVRGMFKQNGGLLRTSIELKHEGVVPYHNIISYYLDGDELHQLQWLNKDVIPKVRATGDVLNLSIG